MTHVLITGISSLAFIIQVPGSRPTAARLANGNLRRVELHWYEAHGIRRRDLKIKTYVDEP